MTTRPTAPRTMLPPNLTRHFYEAQRAAAARAGLQTLPWFQLTATQRADVESELALFREAIRRAEEEQDLLASYNASEALQPTSEAPEDCDCPAHARAAMVRDVLVRAMGLKHALAVDGTGSEASVYAFTLEPDSEDAARVEDAARSAVKQWVADGKPTRPLLPDPPPSFVWHVEQKPQHEPLTREAAKAVMEKILREPYKPSSPVFVTDLWIMRPPSVDRA